MKAFIITLAAGYQEGPEFVAGARTVLSFHTSTSEAETHAQSEMGKTFPYRDGWKSYQIGIYEIPSQLENDGYRFTYQLESVHP